MPGIARRIAAYLLNDAATAEALDPVPLGNPPQWLVDATGDQDRATYAVEVSTKSVELADAAVDGLQAKASSHLTFLLALVPFALAATALSLPPSSSPSLGRMTAFLIFCVADASLLVGVVLASLAGGLVLRGGISLDRLGNLADEMATDSPRDPIAALKAAQAEALRYAALNSYSAGVRVGSDLLRG